MTQPFVVTLRVHAGSWVDDNGGSARYWSGDANSEAVEAWYQSRDAAGVDVFLWELHSPLHTGRVLARGQAPNLPEAQKAADDALRLFCYGLPVTP